MYGDGKSEGREGVTGTARPRAYENFVSPKFSSAEFLMGRVAGGRHALRNNSGAKEVVLTGGSRPR